MNITEVFDPKKEIRVFLLPGAKVPTRSKDGRGYDTHLYEIQSPTRETLWTFEGEPHHSIRHNVDTQTIGENRIPRPVYVLRQMELVRVSFGCIFGMTEEWCAWIARRSSTAEKRIGAFMHPLGSVLPELEGIVDHYQDVPIDHNFRGKPTTLLENYGDSEFALSRGQRVTQLLFQSIHGNWYPEFKIVDSVEELGLTNRNGDSHGSSGTH